MKEKEVKEKERVREREREREKNLNWDFVVSNALSFLIVLQIQFNNEINSNWN